MVFVDKKFRLILSKIKDSLLKQRVRKQIKKRQTRKLESP